MQKDSVIELGLTSTRSPVDSDAENDGEEVQSPKREKFRLGASSSQSPVQTKLDEKKSQVLHERAVKTPMSNAEKVISSLKQSPLGKAWEHALRKENMTGAKQPTGEFSGSKG